MNRAEIRQKIVQAIQNIAPEIDEGELDEAADLREECDLDSVDFLNLITAVKQFSGVSIPESNYSDVMTLDDMTRYLAEKMD